MNGKLLLSQRNLSTTSNNSFSLDSNKYSIELKVISFLKGHVICTLYKNGNVLQRKQLLYKRTGKKIYFRRIMAFMALGVVLGLLKVFMQPSENVVIVVSVMILIAIFIYSVTSNLSDNMIMEDVDID